MRTFLMKLAGFSCIMVLIVHLLATIVRSTGHDLYADHANQFAQFDQTSTQPVVLTVGNSHSGALDFPTLGLNGYHLWLPGGDNFETAHILEHALSKHPSIQYVFVNLTYYTFHHDNATLEEHAPRRKWIYSTAQTSSFIQGDFFRFVIGKWNRTVPTDTLISADSRAVLNVLLKRAPINNSYPPLAPDGQLLKQAYVQCEHPNSYEAAMKHSERIAARHHEVAAAATRNNAIIANSSAAIEQLITTAQENNIQLIFYTPPYFSGYNQLFDSATQSMMQTSIEKIAQKYAVPYYNFADEPTISDNHTLFFDPDHLNLCGARAFSTLFIDQLRRDRRFE